MLALLTISNIAASSPMFHWPKLSPRSLFKSIVLMVTVRASGYFLLKSPLMTCRINGTKTDFAAPVQYRLVLSASC